MIEDNFAHYNIDNEIIQTICDDSKEGNNILDSFVDETENNIKDLYTYKHINNKHVYKENILILSI